MQAITVKRYANPILTGWAGWIEPADRSWIAFIGLDGAPRVYLHRDELGGILPDDAAERERCLAERAADRAASAAAPSDPRFTGNHTGEPNDGSAIYPVGAPRPFDLGEATPPLGERSDPVA